MWKANNQQWISIGQDLCVSKSLTEVSDKYEKLLIISCELPTKKKNIYILGVWSVCKLWKAVNKSVVNIKIWFTYLAIIIPVDTSFIGVNHIGLL